MELTDPNFVEVYRARNLPHAQAIRIALQEAGIHAQIDGELLQGAVGDLPLGWMTVPRVLVDESQIAAAKPIIDRLDIPASGRASAGKKGRSSFSLAQRPIPRNELRPEWH
jgi:hypothetical protein